MQDINTILKLNGLNCLLFGAIFVFATQLTINFLSQTNPAPEIAIVAMGVVLNLYGLLLIWMGNKQKPDAKMVLLIAIGDAAWVLLTIGLILTQTWITELNGITVSGMVAIIVGWFGWMQWKYYSADHN